MLRESISRYWIFSSANPEICHLHLRSPRSCSSSASWLFALPSPPSPLLLVGLTQDDSVCCSCPAFHPLYAISGAAASPRVLLRLAERQGYSQYENCYYIHLAYGFGPPKSRSILMSSKPSCGTSKPPRDGPLILVSPRLSSRPRSIGWSPGKSRSRSNASARSSD